MRKYRLLFLLLFVDALLIIAHIFLRKKLGFFNLDKEGSVKAVFSGLQLLASGGTAAMLAYLFQEQGKRWLWGIVAAGFFYIGLDEMMVLHERIGSVFNRWTGLTGYWGESFNWLIYFSPLIIAALLVYFFLFRILWKEDRLVAWSVLFGALFFAGGIFFEAVGGVQLGTAIYPTLIILEESSQLIGESFFLASFLYFLQKKFNQLYIRV